MTVWVKPRCQALAVSRETNNNKQVKEVTHGARVSVRAKRKGSKNPQLIVQRGWAATLVAKSMKLYCACEIVRTHTHTHKVSI